jgi:hypothetical protein
VLIFNSEDEVVVGEVAEVPAELICYSILAEHRRIGDNLSLDIKVAEK